MQNTTTRINDQVIGYYLEGKRNKSDLLFILLYGDNEIKKYLKYGKQECAASDLNNPAKQHQFKVK